MDDDSNSKPITIVDVAEYAKVAIGTVSRYINGKKVRRENEKRIEDAIKALNYQTNPIARAMSTDSTKTIAVIIDGFDEFHMRILSFLISEFESRGYTVSTFHYREGQGELEALMRSVSANRVDGIVMSGPFKDGLTAKLMQIPNRPVVLFNNETSGLGIDQVVVNNKEISKQAVDYLFMMGHENIAIVAAGFNNSSGRLRYEGYVQALQNSEIPLNEDYIYEGDWKSSAGYMALKQFMALPNPPTAIFSVSYLMTIGIISAAKELGIKIGEDLSLISFDDPDMFKLFDRSITAISQPHEQIARRITDLLTSRISDDISASSRRLVLLCDLILRESVTNVSKHK